MARMAVEFEVEGESKEALFTLKVRRGEGAALLTMDWKDGKPSDDFVGFAIESQAPGDKDFSPLFNRISFPSADGSEDANSKSTRESPIQKFRWMHFPQDAEVKGEFTYRVTPVFMDEKDKLTYGEPQTAAIGLGDETYPEKLNVAFTRGFVSSQAFVDHWGADAIPELLPSSADKELDFVPTHPKAEEALNWMGFEAARAILDLLDRALEDKSAQVRVVAYDLNLPAVVERLEKLGDRLKIIIDDSGSHGKADSSENAAAKRLAKTAGADHVKRQHMGDLQHNKTIVVAGDKVKTVVCGSTNFTWRGFYVQSNNAMILRGETPVKDFLAAFDSYWEHSDVGGFDKAAAAGFAELGLDGIDAHVGFSPHSDENTLLQKIADDIDAAESSVLYSLAFLYQTKGPIRDAIAKVTTDDSIFVYGISDRKVDFGKPEEAGVDVQKPTGNVSPVYPAELDSKVPPPFKAEPSGGSGVRLHHKFTVIDFDKPTARVYLGSYNFSNPADTENGENLVLVKDPGVAISYMVEALRLFDHYHFRVVKKEAEKQKEADERETAFPTLATPPRKAGEKAWWDPYWSDPQKVRDREVFA
jgi:phosphatidylserine/phosphatidylglycerophosphate/cardiolipin synthase-like enzyme